MELEATISGNITCPGSVPQTNNYLNDFTFEHAQCLFQEAIDWMCSQDVIFSDGLGVVGVSKGGDLALMMAAHSPKVKIISI